MVKKKKQTKVESVAKKDSKIDLIGEKPLIKNVKPSGIKLRGFEVVDKDYRTTEGEVALPLRGTRTSCAYDFVATEKLVIKPQEKVMFSTDVKAYMKESEVLILNVRSSIGYKKDLMIGNTNGYIDQDFYNNESNNGNIGICLRNLKPSIELVGTERIQVFNGIGKDLPIIRDLTEENTIVIEKGERVVQGLFVEYKASDNCNTDVERKGGVGSTGDK